MSNASSAANPLKNVNIIVLRSGHKGSATGTNTLYSYSYALKYVINIEGDLLYYHIKTLLKHRAVIADAKFIQIWLAKNNLYPKPKVLLVDS